MSKHSKQDHGMSKDSTSATSTIYPAYAFPAAPTFQKWVKLTAADIQTLRQEPAFEGQNIYFHLNYPIEFVYVIGPVVAIDHFVTKYNTRFSTLEIDDGSGSTIEVKISYKQPPPPPKPDQDAYNVNKALLNPQLATNEDDSSSSDTSSSTTTSTPSNTKRTNPTKEPSNTINPLPTLTTHTFQTTVQNLTVIATPTSTDLTLQPPRPRHPPTKIDIGTVLKAKGTLQRWRDTYQLSLRRVFTVTSVDDEVAYWRSYAEFVHRVLSRPWVLGDAELSGLERQMREGEEERRKKAEQRSEKDRRRVVKRKRWEEKWQRYERRVEEKLIKKGIAEDFDGNALDRVGWRPTLSPSGGAEYTTTGRLTTERLPARGRRRGQRQDHVGATM